MYQPAEILTKWAEDTDTKIPYHVYLEDIHLKRSYSCKAAAHYFGITTVRMCKALSACNIPTQRATQMEAHFKTRDPYVLKKKIIELCLLHGSMNAASKATGINYFCFKEWAARLDCVFYVFPLLRAVDDSHSIGFTKACELVGVCMPTPYNHGGAGRKYPTAMHWLASKLEGKYRLVIPCGMSRRAFKKIVPDDYLVDVVDRKKYRKVAA